MMMMILLLTTGKTTANSIEMAKMVILPTDQLYVDPASGAVQLVVPAANSPTVQPPSWNPFRNGKPTKLRASNGGGGGGGGGLSTNAKQPLTGPSHSTSTMSPPRDRRARVPDEGVSGVTQGVAGALQDTRTMLQDGVMGGDPHGADSGKALFIDTPTLSPIATQLIHRASRYLSQPL